MKPENPKFPIRKLLPLSEPLARQISDFRFSNKIPSETEAMRELMRRSLDAAASQPQREV